MTGRNVKKRKSNTRKNKLYIDDGLVIYMGHARAYIEKV